MNEEKYTVFADKRTSCAYLVYDGEGNFMHDYADDGFASFIQDAINDYAANKARLASYETELAAERAKAKEIKQERDMFQEKCSEFEGAAHAGVNRIAELEKQAALMREALEFYADDSNFCRTEAFGITECEPPHDYVMAGAARVGSRAQKALSLAPSDAAEMARKKDDIIKMLLNTVKWIDGYVHQYVVVASPKDGESVLKRKTKEALEAARAAGVGDK